MVLFGYEFQNLLFCRRHGIVSDLIVEILDAVLFADFVEYRTQFFLKILVHPNDAPGSSLCTDEFFTTDILLAMTYESRGLHPTSHIPCESRKFHSARGHARVIPVDNHDSISRG